MLKPYLVEETAINESCQIIAAPHGSLTPKGSGFWKGNETPQNFQGNLGLVKYYEPFGQNESLVQVLTPCFLWSHSTIQEVFFRMGLALVIWWSTPSIQFGLLIFWGG